MSKGSVLTFHNEDDEALFEQIIIALKAKYKLVSLEQLEELLLQKRPTKNICHISFDDGEISFYNKAFPLLKRHNVPASLFVSPNIIVSEKNYWFQEIAGYDEGTIKDIISSELNVPAAKLRDFSGGEILKCLPFHRIEKIIELYKQKVGPEKKPFQNMNIDQLRAVDASGLVTVGAHTFNHPVLANENDDDCYWEITNSIKGLAIVLGHPIKYFAYPNGRPGIDFGEREMAYLRENKISLAFSTELNNLSSSNDPLAVPRMGFARMGLQPSNLLVAFRLNLGKKWIDIKSIATASEKNTRRRIKKLLIPNPKL